VKNTTDQLPSTPEAQVFAICFRAGQIQLHSPFVFGFCFWILFLDFVFGFCFLILFLDFVFQFFVCQALLSFRFKKKALSTKMCVARRMGRADSFPSRCGLTAPDKARSLSFSLSRFLALSLCRSHSTRLYPARSLSLALALSRALSLHLVFRRVVHYPVPCLA
jgi:hypothetical protein